MSGGSQDRRVQRCPLCGEDIGDTILPHHLTAECDHD